MGALPGTRRAGFTLLELLIVVIVIGTTAALAVPRYQRMMECNTKTMAVKTLRSILVAEKHYRMESGVFTTDWEQLPVDNPNGRSSEMPIAYSIAGTDPVADQFVGRATWRGEWVELRYDPSSLVTVPPLGVGESLDDSGWCN